MLVLLNVLFIFGGRKMTESHTYYQPNGNALGI